MKAFAALLVKEIRDFFTTPLLYSILGFFSLLTGIVFFMYISSENNLNAHVFLAQVIKATFANVHLFFVILAPLLTMHLVANERKNNTMWLLQFSKLSNMAIIWAKFLAVLLASIAISAAILIYPVILVSAGYYDIGLIFSNYMGLILSIAFYLSIGLVTSTMTTSPILAALASVVFIVITTVISPWGRSFENYIISSILIYGSPTAHFIGFNNGIISSYSICYYISGILFFNYLSQRVLTRYYK